MPGTASVTLVVEALGRIIRDLFDTFVLYSLVSGPKTGYDIRNQLSKIFGVKISYGTLYPHLHALEQSGLVSGRWVPHRKNKLLKKREYVITANGEGVLRASAEALSKVSLTLQIGMARQTTEGGPGVILHKPMGDLVSVLNTEGYAAKENARVTGRSGVSHQVDVFASRYIKGEEERIVFGLNESHETVETEDVLKFYIKAYDIGAEKRVFVACPKLSDRARRIAGLYQIKTIEAEDAEMAVKKILGDFDVILG